jgi:signal transduction histidine kinase
LRPILERVADGLPPHPEVAVSVDCSPALSVYGDEYLLEQALASIAANAVQHTKSGSVSLRGHKEDGGSVVLEVADSGPGIAARDQRRIFERFYRGTESEPGTGFGLGLSIARGAVHHLGGRIELESEAGVGTTVRVTLPLDVLREAV